jgi:hypothetical protein
MVPLAQLRYGGGHAGLDDACARGGNRLCRSRGVRGGRNPAGAIIDRYQLHDGLQCAGGKLSNHLPPSRSAAAAFYNRSHAADPQFHRNHHLCVDVQQYIAHVSDQLRPPIAIAIAIFAAWLNRSA